MTDPKINERHVTVYATADGKNVARLDHEFGYVPPPSLMLHRPSVGTVTFYDAACYGITTTDEVVS